MRRERIALLGVVAAAVALRLFRIGAVSLAGDEETTTLAALALLDDWPPTLPGGLVYLRGLPFTAIESLAVAGWGLDETALRAPAALLGGLRVAGVWWLARPLLGSAGSLAAAALFAVLPLDLEISREARMYSLFAAFDVWYLGALVRASLGRGWTLFAGACGVGATASHALGGTHAPVALAAALRAPRGQRWRLVGVAAVVAAAFVAVEWAGSLSYADMGGLLVDAQPAARGTPLAEHAARLAALFHGVGAWLAAPAALLALGLGLRAALRLEQPWARAVAAASAAAAAIASPVLAATGLLATALLEGLPLVPFARRAGPLAAAIAGATAGYGAGWWLAGSGLEGALRNLLDFPAPNWFDFVQAMPGFALLSGIGCVLVVDRAARDGRAAAWLTLVAAALVPEVLSGVAERREGLRYHFHALAPFLVLGLAGGIDLLRPLLRSEGRALLVTALLAALALRADTALAIVQRGHGWVDDPYYGRVLIPDHRGPGRFVRERAQPDEWIAAEDVLQQVLWAGRADVWLRRAEDADTFLRADAAGEPRDVYTGSLPAPDLLALRDLARAHGVRVVWLVTSAEVVVQPEYFRTPETHAALEAWRDRAWFVGEDGETRVYKLVDGEPVPPPAAP